jgi:hypothetical protein
MLAPDPTIVLKDGGDSVTTVAVGDGKDTLPPYDAVTTKVYVVPNVPTKFVVRAPVTLAY